MAFQKSPEGDDRIPQNDHTLNIPILSSEPDGLRQISPESPIRPLVGDTPPKKSSTASLEAAEGSSMRLSIPPSRIRRNSEPHPR